MRRLPPRRTALQNATFRDYRPPRKRTVEDWLDAYALATLEARRRRHDMAGEP